LIFTSNLNHIQSLAHCRNVLEEMFAFKTLETWVSAPFLLAATFQKDSPGGDQKKVL
jgi:hypothetical protein